MEAQSLFLPPQPAFLRRSQQVAPPRAPAVAFAGPEAALQEVEAAFAGPEDAEEKVKEADSRVLSEDGVLDGAKEGLIEFERFRKEGKAQVERQQPRGNVEHLERIMEVYRGLRKAEAEVEKAGVVPRDSEFAKIQQKRREVEVLSKKLRQAQAELKAALESLEALEKSHEESLKNLVISQQSQPLALISRLHRSVAYLDVDFCRCLQQAFQYITQSKPRLNQLYGDLAIAIDLFFAAEGYNARNNCRDTIMRSWEEISDIMEILEKHKNVLSRWNEEFIGSISATRLVKRRTISFPPKIISFIDCLIIADFFCSCRQRNSLFDRAV